MDCPSEKNVMEPTSNDNVNIIDSPENDYVNTEMTPKKWKCLIPLGLHRLHQLTMKYFPSIPTPPTSPTTSTISGNFEKVGK